MTRCSHPSGMSVMLSRCTDCRDSDGSSKPCWLVAAGPSWVLSCWAYLSRVPSGRWQNPVLTNAGKGEIARSYGAMQNPPPGGWRGGCGKGSGRAAQDPQSQVQGVVGAPCRGGCIWNAVSSVQVASMAQGLRSEWLCLGHEPTLVGTRTPLLLLPN